jgi:hypothetical protein
MENLIKIINGRLDEQSLLGKENLSINEFRNILEQVNNLVSIVETTEVMKDFCTEEQRETFSEIMSKITGTKKDDKYPDSIFYMVDDSIYMEQDLKTDNFYIRYKDFWSVFETISDLNSKEISELLSGLLAQHLNCKVNTTSKHSLNHYLSWNIISNAR